jgi:hypothetical protein
LEKAVKATAGETIAFTILARSYSPIEEIDEDKIFFPEEDYKGDALIGVEYRFTSIVKGSSNAKKLDEIIEMMIIDEIEEIDEEKVVS